MKKVLIASAILLFTVATARIHAETIPADVVSNTGEPAQTSALINPNQTAAYPHLTSTTKFILKNVYEQSVSDVSEGIFSIMEYNREYGYSSYFSFYTIEGEYLFPPMWEMPTSGAPRFDSGAAVVKYPRKLNPNGSHAIIYPDGSVRELPTTWKEVSQFYNGVALVYEVIPLKGMQTFYINTNGEKILPHLTFNYDTKGPMGVKDRMRYLKENRRAFFNYQNSRWGFLDNTGKIVITPEFKEVRDFQGGYALAIVRGENGQDRPVFIDQTGKIAVTVPTNASTLYYAEKVSDVDNGIFCIKNSENTTYYDMTGKKLAEYPEGAPFHNGYAFVKTQGKYDSPISIIDNRFNVIKEIGFDDISLNYEKVHFNDLDITTFDKKYVFTDKGELILRAGNSFGDKIFDFSNDGYAKSVTKLTLGESSDNYLGILNPKGELKIVFGEIAESNVEEFLPEPPKDSISRGIIKDPNPRVIGSTPKGPKDVAKATYNIQVIASPEEGGTVTGSGTYHFGDTVRISAKANEGWLISGVEASTPDMNTQHPAKYIVKSDGTITVFFSKIEEMEELQTNAYEGTVTLIDEAGNQMVQFPLYLEIDAEGNYRSPYGDNTYGVFAPLLDPELTLTNQLQREGKVVEGSKIAYNCFYTPFKVVGITTDPQTGKKYLNIDGGQLFVRNMTVLATDETQMNSLNTLMANMMLQFDGMNDIEIPSYSYRIEMRDIDANTGAFTLGSMECFSSRYGWLSSNDERLFKRLRTLFTYGYTKPLPSETFEGIRMEKAPKRTDILWYPSESFFDTEESIVETLGKQYREFASDYEVLRDLNLMDLTEEVDENIFKRF